MDRDNFYNEVKSSFAKPSLSRFPSSLACLTLQSNKPGIVYMNIVCPLPNCSCESLSIKASAILWMFYPPGLRAGHVTENYKYNSHLWCCNRQHPGSGKLMRSAAQKSHILVYSSNSTTYSLYYLKEDYRITWVIVYGWAFFGPGEHAQHVDRQVRATPSIILHGPRDWVLVSGVIYHRYTRANVVSHTSLLDIWGFWFQLFDWRKEKTFRLIIAVIFGFHALRVGHRQLVLHEQVYPACRSARLPDPPAWAPAWLRAARPTTGHTGRHRSDPGRAAESAGREDSVTGHQTSRRTKPERKKTRQLNMCTQRNTHNCPGASDPSHRFHALSPERPDPAEIRTVCKH